MRWPSPIPATCWPMWGWARITTSWTSITPSATLTHRAVLLDQIIISNDLRQYHLSDFHSVIIIPLRENGAVSGTLKILSTAALSQHHQLP